MKALLMAAGVGSRLQPLTMTTPKPLLPVKGTPLIHRVISQLVAAGIEDISINLHHLGEQIRESVGDGSTFNARIRFAEEETLLDTGGTVVQALPWLGDAPFVVANADIYTDFDFSLLPSELGDDFAHLAVVPTPAWRDESDFLFKDGRVVRRGGGHVYCGIGVLSPSLFANAPSVPFSWRDLLFRAVETGRVSGQEHTGFWHDIGTPSQYEAVR